MVMKVYIFFTVRWRRFFLGEEMYFPTEDRENHVSAAHIAIADLRTAACMLKGYLKLQVSQVQRVLHSSTSSWMSKIQFKHIKDNPNYKETTKHKNAFPQNSTISNSKLQTWLQFFMSQKIRKYQQKNWTPQTIHHENHRGNSSKVPYMRNQVWSPSKMGISLTHP